MRSLLLLLLTAAPMPPGTIRYLALGDSFTIGTGVDPSRNFPTQLKERLTTAGKQVTLKNVAVNGYSTAEVIERELLVLKDFKPDLVTLAIGANDAVRKRSAEDYRQNLKAIFAALRDAGIPATSILVLPQPNWAASPVGQSFGSPTETRAGIEQFNAILAEETKEAGARYLDLWKLFLHEADLKWFAPDGLHPSARAYTEWAGELFNAISRTSETPAP